MRSRVTRLWREQPLFRHLLTAAVAMVLVVVMLQSVSEFRSIQLASLAYLGIAAGGLTVLTGINGQLSLGHGALMAIGAYTTALLLPDPDAGTPLVLVVLLATLATVVVGAAVGVAAARLHGPYLGGATLALAVAVPGIALFFKDTLGGEQGLRVSLPDIPVWVLDLAFFVTGTDLSRNKYVAYLAWITLIVTFVLLANLVRSRVGRRWMAVRDDEVAAELAGIDLGRARISAFVVSAAAAGAAGAMLALTVRLTAPSAFSLTLSLTLLTAVVLGGLGSLTGALLGAALLTFLPQLTTDLGSDLGLDDIQAAELAPLVYGLVMIVVILAAPAGVMGTAQRLLAGRRSSPDRTGHHHRPDDDHDGATAPATTADPAGPRTAPPATSSKGTTR